MDIQLFHAPHGMIGQLQTFSHQLETEVGRYTRKSMKELACQLYHRMV